jgi:DNA-binding transcriptional ArsR family regulator
MITLSYGRDDLLRCRFAISPLWETQAAVRTLLDPSRHALHLPWLRGVARRLGQLDPRPLPVLMLLHGYIPDFLTPPPSSPLASIEEELERVRQTPPNRLRAELDRALAQLDDPSSPRELLADPVRVASLLADRLRDCWVHLLAEDWPRIRDLLQADVLYRARRLTVGGIQALLDDLHPDVSWQPGVITVAGPANDARTLDGLGLLLVPSAFAWPAVLVFTDHPWQPTLIYPARGVARLWEQTAATPIHLEALLGRGRTAVLVGLEQPSSTTRLAGRLGLSPGTVSRHLAVLRNAGLTRACRSGHEVIYEQTPLGHALTTQGDPGNP